MKLFWIRILSILVLASASHAETEFERYKRNSQAEFKDYLSANDRAFVQFLAQPWQTVEATKPSPRDSTPKPRQLPLADTSIPDAGDNTPKALVKTPGAEAPTKPILKAPVGSKLPSASFEFYGHQLRLPYPQRFRNTFRNALSSDSIAQHWRYLAEVDSQETIAALEQKSEKLKLNDWGKAKLVDAFVRSFQRDNASRQLINWHLLVKLGFDARIAYNDRVYLLLPSAQEIFGVTFFKLNGTTYYALNLNDSPLNPGQVFTYEGQHGDAKKRINFNDPHHILVAGNTLQREWKYEVNNKTLPLKIRYPEQYIRFLDSMPQLALSQYFSAEMPAESAALLLKQMRPLVDGKTELEAVNALLHFVQTNFSYKTDEQQFGRENYLFPLETLHYPFSDCEDRAALFAWLVRSMLALDVIIVSYPGHVATAVEFSSPVVGDAITHNKKRYIIADPTYMNARVGMSMPTLNLKQARAIAF